MSRTGPSRLLASVMLLAAPVACRPKAEAPEAILARQQAEQQAAEQGIAAAVERFVLHYNSGHADSLAAFFTPDARLLPPNTPAIVGREAIRAGFAQALATKPQLKLVTESISAAGLMAIERGTYEESFTPPGATAMATDRGKYLAHWQRIEGKWLVVENIANSDLPALPLPAPKPRP